MSSRSVPHHSPLTEAIATQTVGASPGDLDRPGGENTMIEWEDRRLESDIPGDIGCDAHVRFGLPRSPLAKLAGQGTDDLGQRSSAQAVRSWRDDDAWVVRLAGELDLAVVETLRAALGRAMGEPRPRLIVDLSDVSFIDSSGVHTILDAYKQSRSAGSALTIRPGPPSVQHVFELTNTLDYLPFDGST